MSADLELRLPAIRFLTPQTSAVTSDDAPAASEFLRRSNCDGDDSTSGYDSESSFDSSCPRTPTSAESKIPASLSCPPAPRKPRPPPALNYKRKSALSTELRFFEAVAGDEVEAFFRSFDLAASAGSGQRIKRRCTCK